MPPRRLRERARSEDTFETRLASRWMMAIDEHAERKERKVLDERQWHRARTAASAERVVGEAKHCTVGGMHREPDERPDSRSRHRLAEERDIRVVIAQKALVDRLGRRPDEGGARARGGGADGCPSSHDLRQSRRSRYGGNVPEGDTLHRAARRLQALVGQRISAESLHPRGRATRVAEAIDGRTLESVDAIGKNLRCRFSGGVVMRSHLRMSGRWSVQPRGERRAGAPWLVLRGDRDEGVLWNGPILELHGRALQRLGPDILERPPRLDAMLQRFRVADGTRTLGETLLDQTLVAGIGNMWLSESLWNAELSPWLKLCDVSEHDRLRALGSAASLMRASLDTGRGIRRVYRRAGQPCPRCAAQIASWGLGDDNRTVYWCPHCQAGMDPRGA
jgi:endonuclease VIII